MRARSRRMRSCRRLHRPRLRRRSARAARRAGGSGDLFPPPAQPSPASGGGRAGAVQGALTPISLAAARAEKARDAKIDRCKYECVRTLERLKAWIARAHEEGVVAVDTETTSLDPMQADLCGFSLARRAERGLLRAARPPRRRRSRRQRPVRAGSQALRRSDPGDAGAGAAQAAARRPRACSRSGRTSNTTGWCSPSAASRSTATTTPC